MAGDRRERATRGGARRAAALGGIIGPVAFVGAWVWSGATTGGYSPVHGAISDLAAVGAPTRVAMTLGFVVFGLAVPIYGWALRPILPGRSWLAAVICGLATLGVAAVPLGRGADGLHGAFASLGYVALTAVPVLAVPALRRAGRRGWVAGSVLAGAVAGTALVATTLGPAHGLFQRVGLSAGDAWLVVSSLAILAHGSLVTAPRSGGPLPR